MSITYVEKIDRNDFIDDTAIIVFRNHNHSKVIECQIYSMNKALKNACINDVIDVINSYWGINQTLREEKNEEHLYKTYLKLKEKFEK